MQETSVFSQLFPQLNLITQHINTNYTSYEKHITEVQNYQSQNRSTAHVKSIFHIFTEFFLRIKHPPQEKTSDSLFYV